MIRESRKQATGLKAHGIGLHSLTQMLGVTPQSLAVVWTASGKITYWSPKLSEALWIKSDANTIDEVLKEIYDYPSLRRRINVAFRKFVAIKSNILFPLPVKIDGIWSIKGLKIKKAGELILGEIVDWPNFTKVPIAKPASVIVTKYDIPEGCIHWFEMALPNGIGHSGVMPIEQWFEFTLTANDYAYRRLYNLDTVKSGNEFLQHSMKTPAGFFMYLWHGFANVALSKDVHHILSTAVTYATPVALLK